MQFSAMPDFKKRTRSDTFHGFPFLANPNPTVLRWECRGSAAFPERDG